MFSFSIKKPSNSNPSPQALLLREIDFSIESIKLKLLDNLDAVKEAAKAQVIESFKKNSKKAEPITFNVQALKAFEKNFSKEMETLKFELLNGGRRFQPTIVNTLEVPASIGFNYGANVYNEKHNMIIACPSNSNMHFYDATDFSAIKQRKKKELNSSVVQMSYWPETDTHLMGCAFGDVYSYNASSNTLTKVTKEGDSFILAITHINANTFAFSSSKSGKLYFGTIDKNGKSKAVAHHSKDSDAWYLHQMKNRGVLLSGLANGKIVLYNTCQSSKFPILETLQAHKLGKYVTIILTVNIKGKEYIITGGNDHTIKIWHLNKGRMRMLKVIQNSEDVSTIVYLENYQMIASTHHKEYVKFFSLPNGKLEATINLGLTKARNVFLMKDKNLLGVADLTRNVIKVVQLHPPEGRPQSR